MSFQPRPNCSGQSTYNLYHNLWYFKFYVGHISLELSLPLKANLSKVRDVRQELLSSEEREQSVLPLLRKDQNM